MPALVATKHWETMPRLWSEAILTCPWNEPAGYKLVKVHSDSCSLGSIAAHVACEGSKTATQLMPSQWFVNAFPKAESPSGL